MKPFVPVGPAILVDTNFYHGTLGALFVGFSCACCLFGVTSQQMVTYWRRYENDNVVYRAMVRGNFLSIRCSLRKNAEVRCMDGVARLLDCGELRGYLSGGDHAN